MNDWFFSFMAVFGVATLVAVVGFIFFLWYKLHSAPGPGIVLGAYEIIGKYAGQKIHTRLQGMVVDATGFFCSSELTQAFKDMLCEDMGRMLKQINPAPATPTTSAASPEAAETTTTEAEKTEKAEKITKQKPVQSTEAQVLEKLVKQVQAYPLDQICRVAIIRNGFFGEKHLIVHFGDPKRSLSDYASNEEESHFNLAFGPVNKGLINGSMQTLPEQWEFPNERFNLGKVTAHVFVPEGAETENASMHPQPLHFKSKSEADKAQTAQTKKEEKERMDIAKLILHIPNAIHIQQHVKSLTQQLRDKDFALQDMGRKLSAVATELDWLRRAVKGFLTEGQTLEDLMPSRIDPLDFICLFTFPTVFYFVTDAFKIYPLVGVVLGTGLASFVIYRRH